ncbi:ATP-binding cassette domain-containing protein [Candidatus Palauibacter sp.]|uniref:ATP-binding cassette domain-containing protein n=1 Tax=Candidatus Palauibacter sp. TaxID=3101350 RepID=UPI003AF26942
MSETRQEAVRPVFAAEGFVKRLGDAEVLRAAAVRAWPGRVTVLLGRNGSGKSTLVRCGLGLLAADNGSVIWWGDATLRPRLARMAREGLFFLPDRGLAVPRPREETHLETLRAAFPRSEPPANQDPLDVAPFAGARIWQLSGGERRRVELTLALLRDPVCLIADEPLAGLSPAHQIRTARAIRDAARRGAAVLATGHEVELLLAVAAEVVWIVAGGTRVLGSPEQAWAHPEFAGQYLGRRRPRDSPL